MKKILLYIFTSICIFSFMNNVYANKIEVKLKTCIDGDTAVFTYDNNKFKARFLAIDTPETEYSERGEQPLGKEASKYTCEKLKNAKNIELEYDKNSDKTDKYDRHLVWVWIDNELLQKDLIRKGYAKVSYLYNNYKYSDELIEEETKAKNNKVGIWNSNSNDISNKNNTNNNKEEIDISKLPIPIIIIIIIIALITKKRKH